MDLTKPLNAQFILELATELDLPRGKVQATRTVAEASGSAEPQDLVDVCNALLIILERAEWEVRGTV